MFFNTIAYPKFLLKSQNQHGLHSPFVYDFVTKGLYKKRAKTNVTIDYIELKNLSKKQNKILSKIVFYFKIDTILFDLTNFSKNTNKKYKLLFVSNINELQKIDFSNLNSKHIILVNSIYKEKKSYQEWQKTIKNKEVTVTIDLFYFGLIFIRKEQAKEHFIIRS